MLRVKEICKEKGITQKILAERLGIGEPALSRIANGRNTTTDTLKRVSLALGVTIPELFVEKKDVKLMIEYRGETKTLTDEDLVEIFEKK